MNNENVDSFRSSNQNTRSSNNLLTQVDLNKKSKLSLKKKSSKNMSFNLLQTHSLVNNMPNVKGMLKRGNTKYNIANSNSARDEITDNDKDQNVSNYYKNTL